VNGRGMHPVRHDRRVGAGRGGTAGEALGQGIDS
jgi:hypothetical protein